MTTDRQQVANARNAKRSTGPRSAEGKEVSRQNAFRHGLALSAAHDPVHAEEIEALARLITGACDDPTGLDYARRIAEQCVELDRIASVKAMFLKGAMLDAEEWASDPTLDVSQPMADTTVLLLGLGRYERRALSRRKKALAAWANWQSA
jgi:hypothetical protein